MSRVLALNRPDSSSAIGTGTLLLFALPSIFQGFMLTPAGAVLQGVYATHLGVPLAALGTAILIARLFDAIVDPMIGLVSDAVYERTGSRKPFLIVGSIITAISLWFLYRPGDSTSITYFMLWFMMVYLGWSITEIPYRAWSIELSRDYGQRSKIAAFIGAGMYLGAASFYLLPIAAFSLGLAPSSNIDTGTLGAAAIIIVLGMPAANLLAVGLVPNGTRSHSRKRESMQGLVESFVRNKPLVDLLAVSVVIGLSTGIQSGLAYIYIVTYLDLGSQLALLLLLLLAAVVVSIPFWGWACSRFEKHRVWSIALIVTVPVLLLLPLVPRDGSGFLALAAIMIANGTLMASTHVAMPALLGDAADYGNLKFGRGRTGVYFSAYPLMNKTMTGVGVAMGLIMAGAFGYDASNHAQSEMGVMGITLTYVWLPAALHAACVPFLWRFPIDRGAQAEIRRQLESADPGAAT